MLAPQFASAHCAWFPLTSSSCSPPANKCGGCHLRNQAFPRISRSGQTAVTATESWPWWGTSCSVSGPGPWRCHTLRCISVGICAWFCGMRDGFFKGHCFCLPSCYGGLMCETALAGNAFLTGQQLPAADKAPGDASMSKPDSWRPQSDGFIPDHVSCASRSSEFGPSVEV
jgi:hypothetical protein